MSNPGAESIERPTSLAESDNPKHPIATDSPSSKGDFLHVSNPGAADEAEFAVDDDDVSRSTCIGTSERSHANKTDLFARAVFLHTFPAGKSRITLMRESARQRKSPMEAAQMAPSTLQEARKHLISKELTDPELRCGLVRERQKPRYKHTSRHEPFGAGVMAHSDRNARCCETNSCQLCFHRRGSTALPI